MVKKSSSNVVSGVEQEIGSIALELFHADLPNMTIVVVVPPSVARIQALSCVMPEVDISRVMDDPNQLVIA